MKLKLNKHQMQALELELSKVLQYEQFDITDKLLAMLLNRLYITCPKTHRVKTKVHNYNPR